MADDRGDLVRRVKEANDIADVVGNYVNLRRAGQTYKGLCPFHNDHRPSFDVDPRRQRYRCWSCGEFGDVITFVMKFEKLDFKEALAFLARRAGIPLDEKVAQNPQRTRLLDAMRWAEARYQECLFDSTMAADARVYISERKLNGETVRKFGLGYAPVTGHWLLDQVETSGGPSLDTLIEVGLIGKRDGGAGCYDRFRDRMMFPIRNPSGQTVGFGGRIMPNSPLAARAGKYYNSAETLLFNKSELLYGLDLAKLAAAKVGYLAVVEGYTDVLMAHQHGVGQVVAVMGTALNAKHVQQLRRFVPRVVLVYDADAGGQTGVDRALEIFVSQDVEVSIATLPDGMDPCDLFVARGPQPFLNAVERSVDALDYKLTSVLAKEENRGIEGQRRTLDAILGIIAHAPAAASSAARVKQELIVTRIAHRLGLREETVWARLGELQRSIRQRAQEQSPRTEPEPDESPRRSAPAAPEERELLECLLAEPDLVDVAKRELPPEQVVHLGLRRMLVGLYDLLMAGDPPDLDGLRARLEDGRLADFALRLQDVGRAHTDRPDWLRRILDVFSDRRKRVEAERLQTELSAADDHATALELLRKLQKGAGTPAP